LFPQLAIAYSEPGGFGSGQLSICTNCGREVPWSERYCPACNSDAGFPNVRLAAAKEEVEALAARVASVKAAADLRGASAELASFAHAAEGSNAVMNRSLGVLQAWLSNDSALFLTFHQQVRSGARLPENSKWDQQRTSAENTINPIFFSHLSYGALALDELGMSYYGPYCITLAEKMIGHRASVFEENPFEFNRRHAIISGQSAPHGYRAPWGSRSDLATSKLGHRISHGMRATSFPDILMEPRRSDSTCDFIEVHIFGPIHAAAIQSVRGPVPERRADKALWNQVKRKLDELGTCWSEY
jgi:hypothetical protein